MRLYGGNAVNWPIFTITIRRYLSWTALIGLSLGIVCWGSFVGILLIVESHESREMARAMLFGPAIPMFLAYSVVCPQVANYQRAKDGEYLSLLFTRPITRASYIITKWAAGSVFVVTVNLLMALVALVPPIVAGRYSENILDGFSITDAAFNSMGYTALVVFFASFPFRIGIYLFFLAWYFVAIISLTTGVVSFVGSAVWGGDAFRVFSVIAQFLYGFFVIGVDSYHLLNSAQSPLLSIVTYASNVVLYLTLAVWVMSLREFFYAND